MATDRVGLFGPDTVTWRVNREAVLLAGGGRALLLQVAHPLVAAGVEQHSNYETDPWGRLYRTLDLTTKIVFGDGAASAEAARRLRARHATVHGVAPDGRAYDANDPDLLLWVWATLVDSALLVYQRYVGTLGVLEIERYYGEQTRFALACAVPEGWWPPTYGEFVEYRERVVREECVVGEDARRIAGGVLHPAVPWPVRPAFEGLVGLLTVGLLPEVLRERYGLDWGPGRERLLGASAASIRRLLPLLPGVVREFPAARGRL
ncbi:MAG TPA: oxygenase MpaB family protein [Solirubrobacteraceae bacterium]